MPVHTPVATTIVATEGAVIGLATVDVTDSIGIGDVFHCNFILSLFHFVFSDFSILYQHNTS